MLTAAVLAGGAFIALALASEAAAAGKIEVKIAAQVPVKTSDASGKKTTKMVDAAIAKVIPGDVVTYTITYTNTGDDAVKEVIVTNPVPPEVEYIEKSASGKDSVMTFSIDGGNTYDVPTKLEVKDKDGKTRRAKASEYTNIKWTLKGSLAPGKGGSVAYRAKIK